MTDKNENLLYECFLDKIEKPSYLNNVISNILDKDIPDNKLDSFLLWFHKKCILDSKFSNCLDSPLINKIYLKLSNESMLKLLDSIKTDKNPCIIECSICQQNIENPHCYSCGHVFCLGCINKYKRNSILRNNEYSCPQCRQIISEDPIKIYL